MDMPEDLESHGLPVSEIPDCFMERNESSICQQCAYLELCVESKEWDDLDSDLTVGNEK